ELKEKGLQARIDKEVTEEAIRRVLHKPMDDAAAALPNVEVLRPEVRIPGREGRTNDLAQGNNWEKLEKMLSQYFKNVLAKPVFDRDAGTFAEVTAKKIEKFLRSRGDMMPELDRARFMEAAALMLRDSAQNNSYANLLDRLDRLHTKIESS